MTNNNSAYQRGASRYQQPQPPAPKKSIPGWLWMAGGMIIGTVAVFLVNLKSGDNATKHAEETVQTSPSEEAEAQAPNKAPPMPSSVEDEQPPKPKFDFYTLLPDSKVIVPPGSEGEPAPAPAPRKAESNTDSALSALAPAAAVALAPAAVALASKAMQGQAQQAPAAPPPSYGQTTQLAPAPKTAPQKPTPTTVAPQKSLPTNANTVALKPAVSAVTVTTNTASAKATTTTVAPVTTTPKVTSAPLKPPATTATPNSLAAVTKLTPVTPPPAPSAPVAPKAAAVTPPQPTAAPVASAPPVTAKPAAAAPAPAPAAPTPAPTLAKAQAVPSPAPAPVTKPQQLFLQAGSFRKSDDADRVRAEMLLIGVSARIETSTVRGETVHRVLVGPYSSSEKMTQAQKQLSENGYSHLIPQKR